MAEKPIKKEEFSVVGFFNSLNPMGFFGDHEPEEIKKAKKKRKKILEEDEDDERRGSTTTGTTKEEEKVQGAASTGEQPGQKTEAVQPPKPVPGDPTGAGANVPSDSGGVK